ncbi:hypothetical protein FMN50_24045 [Rhodobacterales bacterium]|nr:hypothetical protein FMN50_24045 [Rhodobacterales bacterium]
MSQGGVDRELVSVTDSTQITFHQLQDIYNALTGKTEKITKTLDKSYLVRIEDLAQLHARISQCCDSYGAKIKNENISVIHVNGLRETFSSYDRFCLYNKSNVSPVENLHMQYNIILIPSGASKPIQYKINMVLVSRVGLAEKRPVGMVGPLNLFSILGRMPGQVSIEFVDYAAARHFLTQIEEWYDSLNFSAENRVVNFIQSISHWMREVFSVSTLAFTVISFGFLANVNSIFDSVQSVIEPISAMVFIGALAWLVGSIIGRLLESSIDRIQPISYVCLNRGDEKAIERWKRKNWRFGLMSIVSVLVAFSVNMVAAFVFREWF